MVVAQGWEYGIAYEMRRGVIFEARKIFLTWIVVVVGQLYKYPKTIELCALHGEFGVCELVLNKRKEAFCCGSGG